MKLKLPPMQVRLLSGLAGEGQREQDSRSILHELLADLVQARQYQQQQQQQQRQRQGVASHRQPLRAQPSRTHSYTYPQQQPHQHRPEQADLEAALLASWEEQERRLHGGDDDGGGGCAGASSNSGQPRSSESLLAALPLVELVEVVGQGSGAESRSESGASSRHLEAQARTLQQTNADSDAEHHASHNSKEVKLQEDWVCAVCLESWVNKAAVPTAATATTATFSQAAQEAAEPTAIGSGIPLMEREEAHARNCSDHPRNRRGSAQGSGGGLLLRLPCRHCFHPACVLPWLARHDTCPSCRATVTPTRAPISSSASASASARASARASASVSASSSARSRPGSALSWKGSPRWCPTTRC